MPLSANESMRELHLGPHLHTVDFNQLMELIEVSHKRIKVCLDPNVNYLSMIQSSGMSRLLLDYDDFDLHRYRESVHIQAAVTHELIKFFLKYEQLDLLKLYMGTVPVNSLPCLLEEMLTAITQCSNRQFIRDVLN